MIQYPRCKTKLDANKDLLEVRETIKLTSGEEYEFKKVMECPSCGFAFGFAMASFDDSFAEKMMNTATSLLCIRDV